MATFRLSGGDLTLPSAAVGDEQVKTPSANDQGIAASKLQHLFKPGTNFNQAIGGTPVAREEIVFTMSTAGTLRAVHALLNVTGTVGSISIDLKVNGSSVLSGAFNVSNTDGDRAVKDGSISSPNVNAGDVVSLSMAVSGSDGTGPFAWVEIEERAA